MEVMAMEDKQRKENIQNQIQQKIAIANIRKEFAMQKEKNKKAKSAEKFHWHLVLTHQENVFYL